MSRTYNLRKNKIVRNEPEFSSIEEFVQFLLDDERESFTSEELQKLSFVLKRTSADIRKELEDYGLKIQSRERESKGRGFRSNDHNRWSS